MMDAVPSELIEPFAVILPSAAGTWEPATGGDGLDACLLVARDADDEIVDVVAWELGSPSAWWLRWGEATILGALEVELCRLRERPLRVVPTPKAWLDEAGCALCVLNWDARLLPILDGIELRPSSPALERRLRAKLAQEAAERVQIARVA